MTTEDGGVSWRARDSLVTVILTSLSFADQNHVWAVGGAGTILVSTDAGATWRQSVSGVDCAIEITTRSPERMWPIASSAVTSLVPSRGRQSPREVSGPSGGIRRLAQ